MPRPTTHKRGVTPSYCPHPMWPPQLSQCTGSYCTHCGLHKPSPLCTPMLQLLRHSTLPCRLFQGETSHSSCTLVLCHAPFLSVIKTVWNIFSSRQPSSATNFVGSLLLQNYKNLGLLLLHLRLGTHINREMPRRDVVRSSANTTYPCFWGYSRGMPQCMKLCV